MPSEWIDLRSDTVTRPTPGMRKVMAEASVGDDVFQEDPTVQKLEERVAGMFGKEAALFVPSGTMSNQIAVKVHTQPGDELLCDANCHIYVYEQGGPAQLSGVTCRPLDGQHGVLDASQLEDDKIRPDNEHLVRTRLVCLENTHNRGGGKIYPLTKIQAIRSWARKHDLAMHLDGARIWNAIVATGVPAQQWGEPFDTLSVCFSKGLGAPIGSALIGPREFILKARRVRKLFGGGMRQVGILAAAALYALDHHLDRMAEDHAHAQLLAQAIRSRSFLKLVPPEVETNLVWFRVDKSWGSGEKLAAALRESGVLVHASGPQTVRACTHLDVSRAQILKAVAAFDQLAG